MICDDCIHAGICINTTQGNCEDYLSEKLIRQKGEWVLDSDNLPICKECGEVALQRIFIKLPQRIQDVRMVRSNYCPNCGAIMKGKDHEG